MTMARIIPSSENAPKHLRSENEDAEARDLVPFWSDLDQYRLLGELHALYLSLNQQASRPILSERTVTHAKATVCKYNCEKSGMDYEMAVTLRMVGVTVRFSKRRPGMRGALLKFPVLGPLGGES